MSQSATVIDGVTPVMETQEQEEDYDIPEEVETVIGEFLPSLSLKYLSMQYFCSRESYLHVMFCRASAGGTKR